MNSTKEKLERSKEQLYTLMDNISDEKKILCEHFKHMLRELDEMAIMVEDRKRDVIEKLAKLGCSDSIGGGLNKDAEYNSENTWHLKIEFVLSKYQRALRAKEISEEIRELDGKPQKETVGVEEIDWRRKYQNSVAATLSDYSKKGIKFKKLEDGRYWFL